MVSKSVKGKDYESLLDGFSSLITQQSKDSERRAEESSVILKETNAKIDKLIGSVHSLVILINKTDAKLDLHDQRHNQHDKKDLKQDQDIEALKENHSNMKIAMVGLENSAEDNKDKHRGKKDIAQGVQVLLMAGILLNMMGISPV